MSSILKKFQNLFHRHKISREISDTGAVQAVSSRGVLAHPDLASLNAMEKNRMVEYPKLEEYRAVSPARKTPLGNIRAIQKMKHGHQSPWYRKSVHANVKPEDEA